MISITKLFEFEAAHFLPHHKGLCKNLHGHSYKLEVEVTCLTLTNGMICDFAVLKEWVKNIVESYDHKLLNEFFPNPTAELMIETVVNDLNIILDTHTNLKLVRVRLWETSKSYAEWKRD